jgi:hypothetical protein
MPKDLADSVSGSTELIFPDDADGKTYSLDELQVYEAEEVRNELESGDVPQYGSWIPVKENGTEAWLNAPSQLRSQLVEDNVTKGTRFTITEMKKGTGQSDPYQVEIRYPDRPDPESAQKMVQEAGDD